jgi:hypothetical protein
MDARSRWGWDEATGTSFAQLRRNTRPTRYLDQHLDQRSARHLDVLENADFLGMVAAGGRP